MRNNIDITVAVCTYNRQALLRNALDSLIEQKTEDRFNYEIVVIDDGSTDDTKNVVAEIAQKSSVPVRYFYETGVGIARARNKSTYEARGQWIAFFDDDQLAEANWLIELFKTAQQTDSLCIGGARLLRLSSQPSNHLHRICRAFLGEMIVNKVEQKRDRKFFPDTGNTLVHRTVFDTVGGFDESMLWGGSDLDFFRKVRMAGFDVWQTPGAVVYHVITPYRLEKDYLTTIAQRSGVNLALTDYRELGLVKTMARGVTRIVQAFVIAIPFLMKAYLFRSQSELLARKCQLLKTFAYIRQLGSIFSPKLFAQKKFFATINFRNERKLFNKRP